MSHIQTVVSNPPNEEILLNIFADEREKSE